MQDVILPTALCGSDLRLRVVARRILNGGNALLKENHLQEWHPLKVGIIGMPGSGKSGALGVIALLDDLLDERPVWANLGIHAPIHISDQLALDVGRECMMRGELHPSIGLPRGGGVEYAALPLNIKRLLRFDPEYRNGAVVVDEINVKLAEARRSNSNVNRWFNELDQQLRKLHLALYYSTIHEMWVDNRLRDMTDIFIKCEDPAFTVKGHRDKKRPGVDSNWYLYDMHGYKSGTPYPQSHKIYGPMPLNLKKWWGIWDTEQYQSTGAAGYSFSMDDEEEEDQAKPEPVAETSPIDEWGWMEQPLTDIMSECQDSRRVKISSRELLTRLEVPRDMERLVKGELKRRLTYMGYTGGIDYFKVPPGRLMYTDSEIRPYEELGSEKNFGAA